MVKVRGNEEDRELCSLSENVPWKPLNPYSILSMRLQSLSLVKALSQLKFLRHSSRDGKENFISRFWYCDKEQHFYA